MKKIAVYGSLKKGFYNYREQMGEPIGYSRIDGAMYLCYSYPHLYRPEHSEADTVREHSVEIYEVSNEVYDGIYSMEIGAGYDAVEMTLQSNTDGSIHDVVVFYTSKETDYKRNWIESYTKETVPFALA